MTYRAEYDDSWLSAVGGIRLRMALPEILLGLNQTIMFALSMLVITALVGTRDLGQDVYIALTKADTGRGIVAGLAYGGLYRASGRLWLPIVAHGLTNLLLGLWVVHTGQWHFW